MALMRHVRKRDSVSTVGALVSFALFSAVYASPSLYFSAYLLLQNINYWSAAFFYSLSFCRSLWVHYHYVVQLILFLRGSSYYGLAKDFQTLGHMVWGGYGSYQRVAYHVVIVFGFTVDSRM